MNSYYTRRGFTLLEVMVALGILAMAITSLVIVRNEAIEQAISSKDTRKLKMLAELKIGEIVSGINTDKNLGGNFSGEYEDYTWEIKKEPFPLSLSDKNQSQSQADSQNASVMLQKIRVTVQHQVENEKRSHFVEIYLLEKNPEDAPPEKPQADEENTPP